MEHERFMEECFRLAVRGEGFVSPNPLVGAVLVRGGHIVSRGYHRAFGGPHAEVDCLSRYTGKTSDATLYVNLEPCSHVGKTPPCVDAIIAAGIPAVIVAMKDPNPLVAGRGIAKLRRAGVRVEVGVLESQAGELNRFFCRHIVSGRPYVHVKVAQTLDGKIGRLSGHTIVISSRESRAMVHRWRSQYDAVVVGAGTVLADDPALTVRLVEGRNPKAVVLDGAFRVSLNSRLFHPRTRRQGFICVSELAAARHARKISAAEGRGITVLKFPGINDRLRLNSVLREVYRRGIGSLLVEGGSGIFGAFAAGGVIDELSIFIAPDILGEGVTAFGDPPASRRLLRRASSITVTKSGGDVLLQARFS